MFANVHEALKSQSWVASPSAEGWKKGKSGQNCCFSPSFFCLWLSVTLWPRVTAGCQHPNFTFYTPCNAGLQGFRVLPPGRHGSLLHLLLLFDSATGSALNHLRLPATKQAH